MSVSVDAIYLCDSLALLERMNAKQVDLGYLDPPWFSGDGAFHENAGDITRQSPDQLLDTYLSFMTKIYSQTHRVLRQDGVLLAHCEQGLLGYTRLILDQIFGRDQFRHQFVLPARRFPSHAPHGPSYETLLMYSKSDDFFFAPPTRSLTEEEVSQSFTGSDTQGRFRLADMTAVGTTPNRVFPWGGVMPPRGRSWRYTQAQMEALERESRIVVSASGNVPRLKQYSDVTEEVMVGDVWSDLPATPTRKERKGWPGQRPKALLDRVLTMASRDGDTILDPFSGSGTTFVCAHMLGRKWIGCDRAEEAISIATSRLEEECKLRTHVDFMVADQSRLEQEYPIVYAVYPVIRTSLSQADPLVFILNEALAVEETRHYEFKEVKGKNPTGSIEGVADEYAVAFLNSEGGRIFWGVRDSDRTVVGVELDYNQRDRIRRVVTEKLLVITPTIAPTSYRLEFHPVRGPEGALPDLFVVELIVPRVETSDLFFTSGGVAWVKTDGGRRKLTGPEINQEIRNRLTRA